MRYLYCFIISILTVAKGYCLETQIDEKRLIIFGAGYVGTVTGACLASCGHQVTFIEPNESKVQLINAKKSPICEKGLDALVCQGVESGRLKAKSELGDEVKDADVVIIAVPVFNDENQIQDLSTIEEILDSLMEVKTSTHLIVSIRSTILPTSLKVIQNKYGGEDSPLSIVVNPEFLRESTAVYDFFHPPFLVAGGEDPSATETVLSLFDGVDAEKYLLNGESACMIKYACNAFHALKIAFANEMATLAETLDIDPVKLMKVFIQDHDLNCSSAYLRPGFSFGGSCLSKDLNALLLLSSALENPSPLLSSILPSNRMRFSKVMDDLLQGDHQALAVLGITFKKNSDDLRGSPYVDVVDCLLEHNIAVHIFDPDLRLDENNPENNRFLNFVEKDISSTLKGCDGVVLCKDLLDSSYVDKLKAEGIKIYDLGYYLNDE